MNNLDLIKKLAEIEGVDIIWCDGDYFTYVKPSFGFAIVLGEIYDPMTDDGLCFRLMIKYKLRLCHEYGDTPWVCFNNDTLGQLSNSDSPNKAILLAIAELRNRGLI